MASGSSPKRWPRPLCLIGCPRGHQLEVNDAAVRALAELRGPVVVVAIAGLYRTGKSYLMNLLAGSTDGFDLGSTIESKTKGIWAWSMEHPKRPGTNLVLLDTEGLADPDKGDANHDVWIFALAVLLSSTLVYNSRGTIDNDAVDKLHFVTKMSDHIQVRADGEDDEMEFDRFFPNLVWAVRDFTLSLSKDGRDITSDEYLDSALQLKKGRKREVIEYNFPRECLRNFFPSRTCFTFPPPVNSVQLMQQLESLPESQLDQGFRETANRFRDHIYQQARLKTVRGANISGSMLGGLAAAYVKAIQDGAVPCIENAVQQTAVIENRKALEASVELYCQNMSSCAVLPTETAEELSDVHQQCEKAAIADFLKRAIFDDDQVFHKQLMERLGLEYNRLVRENEEASLKHCQQLLAELGRPLSDRVGDGTYMRPGGYHEYAAELRGVEEAFRKAPKKGVKSSEALRLYMEARQAEAGAILTADERLTEEERIQEKEREKREAAELQQRAAEEQTVIIEQQMADQIKSHQENVAQLQEKVKEETRALREEQERVLESRLKEQEQLMKEGFDQRAKDMQEEIAKLQKEQAALEAKSKDKGGFLGTILRPIAEGIFNATIGRFFPPGVNQFARGMDDKKKM